MVVASDESSVVCTVVVFPSPVGNVVENVDKYVVELKRICRTSRLICPKDYHGFTKPYNGMERFLLGLIYSPFKTLYHYLNDPSTTNDSFVGFMKDIIQDLNTLQEKEYSLGSINYNTMVMRVRDTEGTLLLISVKRIEKQNAAARLKQFRYNQVCNDEFRRVKRRIEQCVGRERYTPNLETLMECMNIVCTPIQRHRLIKTPFFYTEKGLIVNLLGMLDETIRYCPKFKRRAERMILRSDKLDNHVKTKHAKVKKVWINGDQKTLKNLVEVYRFLRNCMHHMNEKWEKKVQRREIPQLMQYLKKFFDFACQLVPNFSNTFFKLDFSMIDHLYQLDGAFPKDVDE